MSFEAIGYHMRFQFLLIFEWTFDNNFCMKILGVVAEHFVQSCLLV